MEAFKNFADERCDLQTVKNLLLRVRLIDYLVEFVVLFLSTLAVLVKRYLVVLGVDLEESAGMALLLLVGKQGSHSHSYSNV